MIPFGPYRPDMADSNPGVSARVVNVNPRKDAQGISYHPRRSFQVLGAGDPLPGAPRGALAVVNRAGEFKGYFGTADGLYALDPDYGFTLIGTGYDLPVSHVWGMVQYGDNLLSSNITDGMFVWDIEVGGTVNPVTDAPKARTLFTAFECIFALDCDGEDKVMRNSAPGAYTNWKTQGAGAQEFPDGESLMGGGPLNDGTAAVLQRSAVHLLRVTGDARIYSKVKVADGIGAGNPQSIVQTPGALYFWGDGGIYRLTSAGLEPIGQDKVNRTVLDRVSGDGLKMVEGAYDPERRQVAWRYPTDDAPTSTAFANLLIFDIATGEFAEVEEVASAIVRMSTPALSLENLDQFGSIDELPYSLDSEVWKGGRPRLAALNAAYEFGFFDGLTLPASVNTATMIGNQSMRLSSALPITDAANIALAVGRRAKLADPIAWKSPRKMQPSGRVKLSGRGKAITLQAQIPAGDNWRYLRGIEDLQTVNGGR